MDDESSFIIASLEKTTQLEGKCSEAWVQRERIESAEEKKEIVVLEFLNCQNLHREQDIF